MGRSNGIWARGLEPADAVSMGRKMRGRCGSMYDKMMIIRGVEILTNEFFGG